MFQCNQLSLLFDLLSIYQRMISFQVRILFEETFFNPKEESYHVLCIDQLLEGSGKFTFFFDNVIEWLLATLWVLLYRQIFFFFTGQIRKSTVLFTQFIDIHRKREILINNNLNLSLQ